MTTELKWTTDTPNVEGWYWRRARGVGPKGDVSSPMLIRVYEASGTIATNTSFRPLHPVWATSEFGHTPPLGSVTEWAGPVLPPTEDPS